MSYPEKPIVRIGDDCRPFVAWHLSSAHALFASVDNGALELFDNRTSSYDAYGVKPKHLRKFARALLALADEVDPPAPKAEYFESTFDLFYRQRSGKRLEVWESVDNAWIKSNYRTIDLQKADNGEDDSWPISEDQLPAGAR